MSILFIYNYQHLYYIKSWKSYMYLTIASFQNIKRLFVQNLQYITIGTNMLKMKCQLLLTVFI